MIVDGIHAVFGVEADFKVLGLCRAGITSFFKTHIFGAAIHPRGQNGAIVLEGTIVGRAALINSAEETKQVHFYIVIHIPDQPRRQRHAVLIKQRVIRRSIIDWAIAALAVKRHAHGKVIADWQVGVQFDVLLTVAPCPEFYTEFIAVGEGLFRIHQNRATDIVLAEQCALRATQHLNRRDINGIQQLGVGARYVDTIEVHADTRVQHRVARTLPHTANENGRRFVVGLGKLQTGRQGFHIFYVADTHVVEHIAAQRRDRHGRILQTFLTPPRSDNNLFKHHPAVSLRETRRRK